MRRRQIAARIPAAAVMAAATVVVVAACTVDARVETERDASSEVISQLGNALYVRHCASCHGKDGRGAGPVAPSLKVVPPDLQRIRERNGGSFDVVAVAATIDGRSMPPVHGTREMPVWGARFSEQLGGGEVGEESVRGHLLLLVEYLRSIQR